MANGNLTEADLLARLGRHLGKQGEQHALITHPRDAAGFDATRTLDALSMSLWPSRGLLLHGYEVKCSRSDWQRELKAPEKAEAFCGRVDRFWLVAADKKIVHDGELPEAWGLLVGHGEKLRQVKPATPLREETARSRRTFRELPPKFGRSFLASMMREAVREGDVEPEAIRLAIAAALERDRTSRARGSRNYEDLYRDLDKKLREFEAGLGINIASFKYSGLEPKEVGKRLLAITHGEKNAEHLEKRLRNMEATADNTLTDIRSNLSRLESA